ncbi:hypothetical protein NFI96_019607 [Prochilodus magdalenae]|nr:hypothetical protein NFI96_019607 [Prochilodus magdalenae]
MNTSLLGLLFFIHSLVFLRVSFGASTPERALTSPTAGKDLHARSQGPSAGLHEDYDYDSDEEELSGGHEDGFPRVAFSTKPKDSSVMPHTQKRRTGKGKKNPCSRKKYRGFCIHGVCQYLETLNHTSCVCEPGYAGERCHIFTLPVGKEADGYNQTAAVIVTAVILSLMCLTFIGILLAFRYHKKGDADAENEEKIKLEREKPLAWWTCRENLPLPRRNLVASVILYGCQIGLKDIMDMALKSSYPPPAEHKDHPCEVHPYEEMKKGSLNVAESTCIHDLSIYLFFS